MTLSAYNLDFSVWPFFCKSKANKSNVLAWVSKRKHFYHPFTPKTPEISPASANHCATNCLSNCFAGVFNQSCNAIRGLGTVCLPVLNAFASKTNLCSPPRANGIKKTYALDITTITAASAISNNYVIKRTIFSATSGQTNAYHLDTLKH
jgi:hypothetical protein